jgi:transcriptional regulator with XRE-family HTH domain
MTPEATFGQRLKACRVAAKLTLMELGERTGILWGLVGSYERDRSAPLWVNLATLIRVLGPDLVTLGGAAWAR